MSAFGTSSEPTTEWDDIQRRLGNLPALPPAEVTATPEEIQALVIARAEAQMKETMAKAFSGEAGRDSDEEDLFADLLGDEAGEEIFEEYRRKRMEEFRQHGQTEVHGRLREIGRDEFQGQVSDHKGSDVVLLLYDTALADSNLLEARAKLLAEKFPRVKFLKIQAQRCIAGFPQKNTPALLIYRNGDLIKSVFGLASFGGQRGSADDVEWALSQLQVLKTKLEVNPAIASRDRVIVNIKNKVPQSGESGVA
ncbi:MAG: hypothetical protein Q8P67_21540 [archaeon]|nr:hypothetical protein [archaeon]